jgi:hypothetical protein
MLASNLITLQTFEFPLQPHADVRANARVRLLVPSCSCIAGEDGLVLTEVPQQTSEANNKGAFDACSSLKAGGNHHHNFQPGPTRGGPSSHALANNQCICTLYVLYVLVFSWLKRDHYTVLLFFPERRAPRHNQSRYLGLHSSPSLTTIIVQRQRRSRRAVSPRRYTVNRTGSKRFCLGDRERERGSLCGLHGFGLILA